MPTTRLAWLAEASPKQRARLVSLLEEDERKAFAYHWDLWARPSQRAPEGDWRIWLIMAGRGFGKTRAGAEWVRSIASHNPQARIALVAGSLSEARSVMVEGESGIIACCTADEAPVFEPSLKRLRFPNGARAQLYSAAEPDSLRGPQHSHAWCDEIAKWPLAHGKAQQTWDNLQLGLRLGEYQALVATTTPRAVPLLQRLLLDEDKDHMAVTHGSTFDNEANLSPAFLDAITRDFAGTQLARQEIAGEMIRDIEGSLWTRAMLEQARADVLAGKENGEWSRVVVAVDPPASARGDACGIVVASLGADGLGHVLADYTVENASPEGWARAVANAAEHWSADRVVAEANQGGAMVKSVLDAAATTFGATMPVKLVHASRGKVARAEPVAALYEARRVRHHGLFAKLEDQLCGMMAGGDYEGPGRSPDRADALVWAMTELMLGRGRAPTVRSL